MSSPVRRAAFLLVLQALTLFVSDSLLHRARSAVAIIADVLPGGGDNALFFGVQRPAVIPQTPLHFGIFHDHGLPIASIPLGLGELVIGAPPKLYRTMYVLPKIGLVWSNFFPSWMPTELYGQWWYIEDWRAYVWEDHLEIANGVEFIECTPSVAGTPAAQVGSAYYCPEQPDLRVVHEGVYLVVYYPNGARNSFLSDTGAKTGRYALMEMARRAGNDYVPVRTIVRNYIDRNGTVTSKFWPDRRPLRIDSWKPTAGTTATSTVVSRILLQYQDMNMETRDCNTNVSGQMCGRTSFDHCYDKKCSAERSATTGQQCWQYHCSYFPPWSAITTSWSVNCRELLCGTDPNPDACWADLCRSPGPEGDPKLRRIVMPQAKVPAKDPSARTEALTYTLHYNASSLGDVFEGEKQPRNKFLDHIEDNLVHPPSFTTVQVGSPWSGNLGVTMLPQPAHYGNTMQFGYDKVNLSTLMLKSVSYEAGRDVHAHRFEFQDYGLFQRVWDDRSQPYTLAYGQSANNATRLVFRDPLGLAVEKTYARIGDADPQAQGCDPATGCNVQWGLVRMTTPEGGRSTYAYSEAEDASHGKLREVVAIDGSVTSFGYDPSGRVITSSKGCIQETYGYQAGSAFPFTPQSVKRMVAGQEILSTFQLCEGAGCPGFELGSVQETKVTYPSPGGSLVSKTTHTVDPQSGRVDSRTTVGDGQVNGVVANLLGREPVLGLPRTKVTPGARTTRSETPTNARPNNPAVGSAGATSAPACDPSQDFCNGADQTKSSQEAAPRPYPVQLDEETGALARALNLSDFDATKVPLFKRDTTANGVGKTNAAGTGTEVTSEETTYAVEDGTGAPLQTVATTGAVKVRTAKTWAQVEVALDPRKRSHPSVVLAEKVWSKVGDGAEIFRSGTWQTFSQNQFVASFPSAGFPLPKPDDMTNATHLGPRAAGHFKADGESPSFPDWVLTGDPRYPRYSVVGCPDYVSEMRNQPCITSEQCDCGFCSYGQCQHPQGNGTFICRQTYIRDPKELQDHMNNLGTELYNTWWWRNKCAVPTCATTFSTLYCDNPKPVQ